MISIERIAEEVNLLKSWIKVKHFASTSMPYFDRLAYEVFEDCLNENLKVLQSKLLAGEYQFSPLRYYEVPKGTETRRLYFLKPSDDVVAQAVINVIGPVFEDGFSDTSFGNRLNVRQEESKEIFRSWPSQYEQYAGNIRRLQIILLHFGIRLVTSPTSTPRSIDACSGRKLATLSPIVTFLNFSTNY